MRRKSSPPGPEVEAGIDLIAGDPQAALAAFVANRNQFIEARYPSDRVRGRVDAVNRLSTAGRQKVSGADTLPSPPRAE